MGGDWRAHALQVIIQPNRSSVGGLSRRGVGGTLAEVKKLDTTVDLGFQVAHVGGGELASRMRWTRDSMAARSGAEAAGRRMAATLRICALLDVPNPGRDELEEWKGVHRLQSALAVQTILGDLNTHQIRLVCP